MGTAKSIESLLVTTNTMIALVQSLQVTTCGYLNLSIYLETGNITEHNVSKIHGLKTEITRSRDLLTKTHPEM